jgi:hypothetical protein
LRKDEPTHDLPDGLGDIRTVDGDRQKIDNAALITGDVEVLQNCNTTAHGDSIYQPNRLVLRVKMHD